jgi:hypothetical protein
MVAQFESYFLHVVSERNLRYELKKRMIKFQFIHPEIETKFPKLENHSVIMFLPEHHATLQDSSLLPQLFH